MSAPEAFVFMKVGDHAGESFEQILERKRREIEIAGRSFWGYGGATCHPLQQVQPFVRTRLANGSRVGLLMEAIHSTADPDVHPATEFSADGINWEPIPDGIVVTGSRYALVLEDLSPGDLDFHMDQYEVAVGPSRGTAAADYLRGRVDKGCLVRREGGTVTAGPVRKISFTATLADPFAVMLRS